MMLSSSNRLVYLLHFDLPNNTYANLLNTVSNVKIFKRTGVGVGAGGGSVGLLVGGGVG